MLVPDSNHYLALTWTRWCWSVPRSRCLTDEGHTAIQTVTTVTWVCHKVVEIEWISNATAVLWWARVAAVHHWKQRKTKLTSSYCSTWSGRDRWTRTALLIQLYAQNLTFFAPFLRQIPNQVTSSGWAFPETTSLSKHAHRGVEGHSTCTIISQ